jgi:hypothetical protein
MRCRFILVYLTHLAPPSAQLTAAPVDSLAWTWMDAEQRGRDKIASQKLAPLSSCNSASNLRPALWQLNSLDVSLILVALAAGVLLPRLDLWLPRDAPKLFSHKAKCQSSAAPRRHRPSNGAARLVLGAIHHILLACCCRSVHFREFAPRIAWINMTLHVRQASIYGEARDSNSFKVLALQKPRRRGHLSIC